MNFEERTSANVLRIPELERQKISSVLRLFQEADTEVQEFQNASGLKCLPGCGRCCESPESESTVLEMLPAAAQYFARNGSGFSEDTIEALPAKGVCQFYRPDPIVAGHGRCANYEFRPSMCRLFGFSARMNKHNQPELMTCAQIRGTTPAECERAQEQLSQGTPAPQMQDYSMKFLNIDPVLAAEKLPINLAFRRALERIAFLSEMGSER